MTSSMKLFEFVQECHQSVGICSIQTNQKQRPIFSTKIISLISSAQITFTTAAFLVIVGSTLFDYGFAFYMLITEINSFVIYLILAIEKYVNIYQKLRGIWPWLQNFKDLLSNRGVMKYGQKHMRIWHHLSNHYNFFCVNFTSCFDQ